LPKSIASMAQIEELRTPFEVSREPAGEAVFDPKENSPNRPALRRNIASAPRVTSDTLVA